MARQSKKVELRSSDRAPLPGAQRIGPADPNEIIDVTVVVRRRSKTSGGFPLLEELGRTPIAKRRHLGREEFAKTHGALPEDLARIRAFAEANGLRVKSESIPRRSVVLTGSVSAFSRAFEVELSRCRHPHGEYRGRTGKLKIPEDLADAVEGVFGLDNRPQATPHFRRRKRAKNALEPRLTGKSLTPPQVAQAYDFPANLNSAGHCCPVKTRTKSAG